MPAGQGRVGALRRLLIRVLALYGTWLAILLHTPLSDYFVQPLIVWPAPRAADAVVVLTAWAAPDGTMNEAGVWRTLEAAQLYRDGLAPLIVISGRSPTGADGDPSEAMARMLRDVGIAPGVVELERRSTNTHESALRVAELAQQRGWRSILLVTDAKHMRRARGAFVRVGLEVAPAPTMLSELGWGQPWDRYRKFYSALHEYGGLAYYWARGWI